VQVREYLQIALGEDRLSKILASMSSPPAETCIRVNSQRCSTSEALDLLKAHLADRHERDASLQPHVHPVLKNVLCIPGARGNTPNYSVEGTYLNLGLQVRLLLTHLE
jgi:16S rRNA C967 or C1407 C5-methylase (RsmB/RsmF family)